MHLSTLIDSILESKKYKLYGKHPYVNIIKILNGAFKKPELFRFSYELQREFIRSDFSVAGLYDIEKDKKYIILNFPKRTKTFTINDSNWNNIKFAISQVCQHEAIHQMQWHKRIKLNREKGSVKFHHEEDYDDMRVYLADIDEIDAYAHDIVMEIKYFYPGKDPYMVLKNIDYYKKIWSYTYYKNTFKGTDWSNIRNRLIKKTYKWIPKVNV